MKKIFSIILAFAFTTAINAQEVVEVPFNKLPDLGQKTLKAYFPNSTTQSITKEKSRIKNVYTVILDNGTTIVFNKDGNWKEVECKDCDIPTRLIPPKIIMALRSEGINAFSVKKMWKDKDDAIHIILDNETQFNFDPYFKILK